jgi:hypothetical protein
MEISHSENTLFINGSHLNQTFENMLLKWDTSMTERLKPLIAGERAEEIKQLTDVSGIKMLGFFIHRSPGQNFFATKNRFFQIINIKYQKKCFWVKITT